MQLKLLKKCFCNIRELKHFCDNKDTANLNINYNEKQELWCFTYIHFLGFLFLVVLHLFSPYRPYSKMADMRNNLGSNT